MAPRRTPRPSRILRRSALGALAAVAVCGWEGPAFHTFSKSASSPRVVRQARKPGEAPGGASVAESGLGAPRAKKKVASVGPVVDESDFSLDDDATPGVNSDQKESFESLMKSAEQFALKKDRGKRTRSNAITLEDDLQGLSLEDDVDLSVSLMSRARTGKTDVSLAGRLTKWAEETKELITNPTPIQITYSLIFALSVGFLFLIGVFAASLGAFRLRGDGLDVELRRQKVMSDPFTVRRAAMMDYKRRAMMVEDIRELGTFEEEVAKASSSYMNPPSAPDPLPSAPDPAPIPEAPPVTSEVAAPTPEAAVVAAPEVAAPAAGQ